MKKVIILVRILWTAGAQKIAINETRSLKELGFDVKLVFLRKGGRLSGYEELISNIPYRIIANGRRTSVLSPIYSFITGLFFKDRRGEGRVDYDLIRKFPKCISDELPDMVVCHDLLSGLAGYYAHRKYGVKYTVIVHERVRKYNVPVIGKLANLYEKKVLNHAAKVFAVTDKVSRTVQELYGIRPITSWIGIEENEVIPYIMKKDIIVAVSMWDSGRRPYIYLDVAERLPKKYEFLIVGNWRDARLLREFEKEIELRKLSDKVHLRVGISEESLSQIYRESKFLIRFGFEEYGLATAVVEAFSHAIPVIINSELGTSNLVSENNVGFVVDPYDTGSIVSVINTNDLESKYTDLQENIKRLRKNFNWENHSREIISCT